MHVYVFDENSRASLIFLVWTVEENPLTKTQKTKRKMGSLQGEYFEQMKRDS